MNGRRHTQKNFDEIKEAVANIATINYYNPAKDTQDKCDASHSGHGATLKQKQRRGLDANCFCITVSENTRDEVLAVVWTAGRFKHYLLGREFTLATDHKALTSALGENRSKKTHKSRLTRWVDRLLPYQFKIVHIPGKDMGIVDYLSKEPNGESWTESELDEKFVVTSIENFLELSSA